MVQLNGSTVESAKSDQYVFLAFNSLDATSCAPTCLSIQSRETEACDNHDAARAPKTVAPLRVLPKWSCRVREINSLVRSAGEPSSGQKRAASDMYICFDLPYKRQQVYHSEAEDILEVVEADH